MGKSKRKTMTWIPCSMDLPEYGEKVLVNTKYWGVRAAYRVKDGPGGFYWNLFLDDAKASRKHIYSWLVMPEPYTESEYEDGNYVTFEEATEEVNSFLKEEENGH